MFGSFAGSALAGAVTPLVVQFQNNPLFSEANFLPGSEVVRTVGVTNNSDTSQAVMVEAINVVDTGGLGDKLNLLIQEGGVTKYSGTLGQFLRAGEVALSPLATGVGTTYSFTVTFDSGANNDTQNTTLGFDLCVGFSGGDKRCGNTTVVDGGTGTGDTNTGTGGGGGTGGVTSGSNGPNYGMGGGNGLLNPTASLIIFNEKASQITGGDGSQSTGTALITWETNLPATSWVVYGPNTTTYAFNINNFPAFSYPVYTSENMTQVTYHAVLLTGLTPGRTYSYRVASRITSPTVSSEHQFTVPLLTQVGNNIFTNNVANAAGTEDFGQGGGQGAPGETPVASTTGLAGVLNGNLAATFLSGLGDLLSGCTLIALLILLLIYLVWSFWLRPRYEKSSVPEEQIKTRFFVFYGLASALAAGVCFILGQYCPIPIFLIAFVISLCFYAFRKFQGE